MTWIEVTSDAVKIGLGALIGGLSAVLGSFQSHKYRIKEEYSKRRRDQLEKIMIEFDATCLEVMSTVAKDQTTDAAEWALRRKEVGESRRRLNAIEAKVSLLDFADVAKEVAEFRDLTVDYEYLCDAQKKPAKENDRILQAMYDSRSLVIPLFAAAYKKA